MGSRQVGAAAKHDDPPVLGIDAINELPASYVALHSHRPACASGRRASGDETVDEPASCAK